LSFALSAVLLLALLGLLATVLHRHDLRWDVTSGKRRTLAPQTLRVLELLDRPVDLVAFYADVPQEQQLLLDLVERYRAYNPRLTLEFVDLDRRPEMADLYGVTLNRTVVLRAGDLQVKTVAPSEAELTGALLRLLNERPPLVFFVTGHGEASVEDASRAGIQRAAEALRKQNFEIRMLSTAAIPRIPAEADVLILASPESPYTEHERAMLLEYLLRGGRLLAMVEPMGSASVDSFLQRFGVIPESGFVVDASEERRNLTSGGNFRIALAQGANPEHPITRGFSYAVLFPLARSLQSVQPPPAGLQITRLLETGAASWTEQELEYLIEGTPEYDEGVDRGGPLPLAFAVEVALRRFRPEEGEGDLAVTLLDLMGDRLDVRDSTLVDSVAVGQESFQKALPEQARLVVIGDVDFINNANLLVQGNSEFLVASVLWLTEQENRIALPARENLSDPVVLSGRQRRWIRIAGIAIVPGLFFVLAAAIHWRRRQWL
jgi:ABC-type uncharacterized transport system involved in gliding motility auxiliary subunit